MADADEACSSAALLVDDGARRVAEREFEEEE